MGRIVIDWGTITSATLPADNGTWAVLLVAGSKDTAFRPLREPARWEAMIRSLPLAAHWLDGTPAFHAATAETVEPWYRATLATDRHRLGEIEAGIRGVTYDPQDPAYELDKALRAASGQDGDCLRALLDIRLVLRTPEEVFARPGLRDKTLQLGSGWRDQPPFGPTREQLLALASAP